MTVNRPWTCSPTARFQQRARFRRTTSSGPFDRVPEADSEFAPGYSWPPHLYQENPSVEEAGQPVNGARLSVVGQFAATRLSRTRLCASQRAELGGLARMTERKRSEMHASSHRARVFFEVGFQERVFDRVFCESRIIETNADELASTVPDEHAAPSDSVIC